ncbi:MAG: hypothetical protein KatS3mg120_2634 [Erythrobacter sp.]|nr:MAG: hypothetical protein KatS3mg120_2634 [Erythrobacter sp.]
MQLHHGQILCAPTDLVRFLGCNHATALDLLRLRAPANAPAPAEDDAMAELVQQAGLEHEERFRARLADEGGLVEIPVDAPLAERARVTAEAMRQGPAAIFQAAFLQPPWSGFADFLVRVEEPSQLGEWSYEPVDTKLARSAKASHLVQLGLYARMIAAIQGRAPRRVHVALRDGRRETFRLADFDKVLSAAMARFMQFVSSDTGGTAPEPCAACQLCPWREHCGGLWEAAEHLSRVTGLGRPQASRLRDAGVATLTALAALPDGFKVPRMAPATRRPMVLPDGPNQRWSLELGAARPSPLRFESVFDSLICGRRFRILCVVDDDARECLALVADTSLSGARVARELTSLMGSRGKPHMVVSDNGTELTSSAILRWSQERRVEWHYIAPGKPMQNGLAAPPWGRGKLQRSPARRMPQRDPVHLAGPCPVRPRRLAARLQYGQATLQAGREDPRRHRRPTCQTHIMKKRDSTSDW